MNRMTKRTLVLAAAAFGAVGLGVAWATPAVGVVTTILNGGPVVLPDGIALKSEDPDHHVQVHINGDSDVYVVHNKIAPGGHTGWHMHPGVSIISVKAGVATEYHGDDPGTPHVYVAGTAFGENTGHTHLIRNEGTVDLELVAFQIIPQGAPRRIDAPQP